MNIAQLGLLQQRARRMAYVVRHEEEERADTPLIARAWERLEDAAYALEAIYVRKGSFKQGIPPDAPPPEPAR